MLAGFYDVHRVAFAGAQRLGMGGVGEGQVFVRLQQRFALLGADD
jgi:hypothetical protein